LTVALLLGEASALRINKKKKDIGPN
jgi:hypothetical protein